MDNQFTLDSYKDEKGDGDSDGFKKTKTTNATAAVRRNGTTTAAAPLPRSLSSDAKLALLRSLGPVVEAMNRSRKADVASIEDGTGCRPARSRGGGSIVTMRYERGGPYRPMSTGIDTYRL